MVIPGAMAISVFSGIENPDMVYSTIVLKSLPSGLIGLVLAGLLSAIMSSVDSTLNSSSTLVIIDFIKPKFSSLNQKQILKYGRITTFILMTVAALWAPMIEKFGGIWIYLQQMYTIFVPPIVVLFLVGVFYKKGNAHGAYMTLILGTVLGITLFILQQLGFWKIHFTITAGIVVFISAILFIIFSNYKTPPTKEVIEKFTFNKSLLSVENLNVKWYENYQLWSLILFIIIVLLFFILQ